LFRQSAGCWGLFFGSWVFVGCLVPLGWIDLALFGVLGCFCLDGSLLGLMSAACLLGWVVHRVTSMESLILAQDERWRRA
jgi:hypothetical protein